jgi:RND family efflux transporter MFP subunit
MAFGASFYLKANKPEARVRPDAVQVLAVEATRLQASDYPVVIRSQGTAQPTHTSTLVPEVSGTITQLSDAFVVGGRFEQGETLVKLDARDYEIALTQADANLAQAEAQLQEQIALAQRAVADWESMNRRGQPSALTLRKPQLAAAEANRDAAQAQVERARLDLQRTQIIAPYRGIVSETHVDPGQFIARGSAAGRIYSIASIDVRLPLSNRQLTHLDLDSMATRPPEVTVQAVIGNSVQAWTGKLIRAEGMDAITQQLTVVAQIRDPLTQGQSPLRDGQFVEAFIRGDVLEQVFVIPRSALREEREVLLIAEDQTILRQPITVTWSDNEFVAVNSGLRDGDLLVTTSLSTIADGTPVEATVDGVPMTTEIDSDCCESGQKIN